MVLFLGEPVNLQFAYMFLTQFATSLSMTPGGDLCQFDKSLIGPCGHISGHHICYI